MLDKKGGKVVKSATRYQYVTKGDANPAPDIGEVQGEDVKGELLWTIPGFGLFKDGMDPRAVLFVIAGIIAALWVVWELGSRVFRRRNRAGGGDMGESADPAEWSPESAITYPARAETPDTDHAPHADPPHPDPSPGSQT
jgi:hypothetical protein